MEHTLQIAFSYRSLFSLSSFLSHISANCTSSSLRHQLVDLLMTNHRLQHPTSHHPHEEATEPAPEPAPEPEPEEATEPEPAPEVEPTPMVTTRALPLQEEEAHNRLPLIHRQQMIMRTETGSYVVETKIYRVVNGTVVPPSPRI